MSQITLIQEKQKGGKVIYQVQRDGIAFLRKLKHKKLRIIFNISYQNIDLSHFNQSLLNDQKQEIEQIKSYKQQRSSRVQKRQTLQHQNLPQANKQKQNTSWEQKQKNRLTIHTHYKQIQDNRVILALNAYQKSQSDPNLLILGYLASSVVFYHNYEQKLSHDSNLTGILNKFSMHLKKTNIDILQVFCKNFQELINQVQIRIFKNPLFQVHFYGAVSKLYRLVTQFLQNRKITQQFNNFYHYSQEQQPDQVLINNAVQCFVDYFPERSSIILQTKESKIPIKKFQDVIFQQEAVKKINQLGRQFQTNILGRQLFNFQFTGTTIQNLCFQMCDCFNNKQKIDLLKSYNKVILNQKSRVFDQAIKFYLDKVAKVFFFGSKVDIQQLNGSSIFPISQFQLTQKHQQIQNQIINQAFQDAQNCMSLQQFKPIYSQVKVKLSSTFQKLKVLNLQKGLSFCDECFNILQNFDFPPQTQIPILSNEQIAQCFQCITYKAELFSNQCLGLFAQRDSNAQAYNSNLIRLLKNYLQRLSQTICNYVQTNSLQSRSNILEIQTLKFDIKKIKAQNKRLSQEYQLQEMIINEYKNKVGIYIKDQKPFSIDSTNSSTGNTVISMNNNCKQFYEMKKKVQQLQQEVLDKNIHIDELTDILDRFQTKGHNQKNQFSSQLTKLTKNIGQQINKFYALFQQIKNIQKTYQKAKKGLSQQKQNYFEQKKKDKQQLANKAKELDKIIKQKKQLEQIINQAKLAIQVMKQVQDQFKEGINKLEIDTGSMSCLMAQRENELETYKKAAKLLIQQISKGKCEKLSNFYKVTDNEQLKELLKPIIKK